MMTINLLPTKQTHYAHAVSALRQLLGTGETSLRPNILLERAQEVLQNFQPAEPFAVKLHHLTAQVNDLWFDGDYSPEAVQPLLKNLRSRNPISLIPGYSHLEPIRTGSVSAVYRALRQEDGQVVAIKVGRLARNPQTGLRSLAVERLREIFEKEWSILNLFDSDRIVRPIERGSTDREKPYIVMEYVEGGSLYDWIDGIEMGQQPFDLMTTFRLALGAVHAVADLHKRGILHNDPKPGNFLIAKNGVVKVCDFSLATPVSVGPRRNRRGWRTTPGFESIQSTESTRTEVLGLGAILFNLFTNKRAFNPGHPLATLLFTPPPPSRFCPKRKIPETIDRIVMKALHRDPNRRYGDAVKMLEEMKRVERRLISSSR